MKKKTRVAVYKKFDGHCAYCGRHIAYNDMQVDHFKPQRAWNPEDSGTDDIENLMPSCRMCNHYKRAHDLETFRRYIAEIPRKLQENYIYKVGVVYGNVLENPKAIKFYFEKVRDTMRLIDADKIVEVAEHAYGEWNKAMGAAEGRQINRCYKMQELCKAVKGVADDCPTIDPESLRPTARWKHGGIDGNSYTVNWICRKCGKVADFDYKYCPSCGARMVNTDE